MPKKGWKSGRLTLREIATQTGYCISYISRVLRAQREPKLTAAYAIAKTMGISLDQFAKSWLAMIKEAQAEAKKRKLRKWV